MLSLFDAIKNYEIKKKEAPYKSRRDELVSKITEGINQERKGTDRQSITKRLVAIRINQNPFLAKSDDEVELLYKTCVERGNFSKFFWATQKIKNTSASGKNSVSKTE